MKDIHAEEVGARIFALITTDYGSDVAFERAVGLPDKTVNNWRRGRSASYMKMLPMLAEAFSVTVGDLLRLPIDPDGTDLSEEERHLVSLYRETRFLPAASRAALAETISSVIRLYLSGLPDEPTKKQNKK